LLSDDCDNYLMNHKEMLNDWSININDITLTVFRVQTKETHLFLCECKNMFQNHPPTIIELLNNILKYGDLSFI